MIGIAIIAVVVLALTVAIAWFGAKRSKGSAIPLSSSEPSSIALSGYNTPRGEDNSYRPGYGEGPPVRGEGNNYIRGSGNGQPVQGRRFV